jgi:hypothetical protein
MNATTNSKKERDEESDEWLQRPAGHGGPWKGSEPGMAVTDLVTRLASLDWAPKDRSSADF